MPHYNGMAARPEEGRGRINPQKTVEIAFSLGFKGRRQADMAVSQLEGLLARDPPARPALASAAVQFLSGTDLTDGAEPTQATAQSVLRRLSDALEGSGSAVTKTLLSDPEIAQIREFRHRVRELLTAR